VYKELINCGESLIKIKTMVDLAVLEKELKYKDNECLLKAAKLQELDQINQMKRRN